MGKTAVIVIHGVGEQRPMGTVSSFTRFFAGDFFRSKPDLESTLFDLRRLSTYVDDPKNPPEEKVVQDARAILPMYPPSTVFYEFYWAFHYRETKPTLVIRWTLRTLWKFFRTGRVWTLGRKVVSVTSACVAVMALWLGSIVLVARGISHLTHPDWGIWRGT